MSAHSPSRIFLARGRPSRDHLDEATTAELRVPPRPSAPVDDHVDDLVIDLTGPTPSTTVTPRPPRPRRRWPLVVAATVLVLAAVGAVAAAAANYTAAMQWRERATTAEQRAAQAAQVAADSRQEAEDARRAGRVARQRRRALADQLAVSEADGAALEARIVALASDRARAQDLGGGVAFATPDTLVRSLQAQVDSCVAQIDAVRTGLAIGADVDGWQRAMTAAEAACEQVASDIDALAAGGR